MDGGAHERDGLIAFSAPSPLTCRVDLDDGQIAPLLSLAQEHLADLGQELLSAVTLRSGVTVDQRKAQRQPGLGQCEIVTGALGNLQCFLDLTHRRVVGPDHASRYPPVVDVGDDRGKGQWIGAAGQVQAVPQVVAPTRVAQETPGKTPCREGER